MDAAEREKTIARFESGETLVLSSCDIVSEGFDLPAIEVAILLRPTESLSLYLQQVGRALRTFPGKKCAIILDHVGAVARHGLPDEDRDWSLDGVQRRRRAANDNEPGVDRVTTCPKCFTVHLPAPRCPTCDHVYPVKERVVESAEGNLIEITGDQLEALRRQKRAEQTGAKTLDDLIAVGRSRGMKQPEAWARHVLRARMAKYGARA